MEKGSTEFKIVAINNAPKEPKKKGIEISFASIVLFVYLVCVLYHAMGGEAFLRKPEPSLAPFSQPLSQEDEL